MVSRFDLSDNQIRAQGANSIGRAIQTSTSLEEVSLRLNRLGDDGAKQLCDAAQKSTTLQSLNISGNGITPAGLASVVSFLHTAVAITSLDLSSNRLGEDAGRLLREAVDAAPKLERIDLRQTGINDDMMMAIGTTIRQRSK